MQTAFAKYLQAYFNLWYGAQLRNIHILFSATFLFKKKKKKAASYFTKILIFFIRSRFPGALFRCSCWPRITM